MEEEQKTDVGEERGRGEGEEEEKPGDRPSLNLLLIQHSREVRRVLECAATLWRPSEKPSVRF